ncbi:hypothetical protein [Actinomadura sp. 6K520]|jgi:hypothetical protein|uniref:hypothetical protein n=1 Tax=Actinomadura sp. 6K520 TaxID=2530364 RepID=UPI00104F4C82|nr:hypothetical protein [Actinomadura sp. 6K520]TDE36887.1 hypothetical protein E1289_04845 [Actinomadura sp. 6K520]
MRGRVGFIAVWTATTLTGMAISWAGVSGALRGTAEATPDLAAEVPVRHGRPPVSGPSAAPSATSGEPSPSASASASPSRPGGSPTAAPGGGRSPYPETSRRPDERVRTYTVKSGRVVLALSDESARLVSATPDDGFQAKVWRQEKWLRVDLTDDVHGSAVFATWHDGAVRVQVYEY